MMVDLPKEAPNPFYEMASGATKPPEKRKKSTKGSEKGKQSCEPPPPPPPPPPAEEDAWDPEPPMRTSVHYDRSWPCEPEAVAECDLPAADAEKEDAVEEKAGEYETVVETIPDKTDWDFIASTEPEPSAEPSEEEAPPIYNRPWLEEEIPATEAEPMEAYEEPVEEAKPAEEEEHGEPKPDGYMQEEQKTASLPFSSPYRLMIYLQQILEEACFASGRKNWPELLRKRNWDCVEAVSLTMWVKEFEHLQYTLDTQPSRGLLQSIAKIQTITVDRRSINWPRMKKFFNDAFELTEILNVKEYGEIIIQIRINIGKTIEGLSRDEEEAQSLEEKKLQWIAEERRKLDEREAEVRKGKEKSMREFRKSAESEVERVLEEAKKTLETAAFFSGLEATESFGGIGEFLHSQRHTNIIHRESQSFMDWFLRRREPPEWDAKPTDREEVEEVEITAEEDNSLLGEDTNEDEDGLEKTSWTD